MTVDSSRAKKTERIIDAPTGIVHDEVANVHIIAATAGAVGLFVEQGKTVLLATPPTAANSVGVKGEIAWDANNFYICVATNTWIKFAQSCFINPDVTTLSDYTEFIVERTLTSDDVQKLSTEDLPYFEIVPAAGVGKAIFLLDYYAALHFVAPAYTDGANIEIGPGDYANGWYDAIFLAGNIRKASTNVGFGFPQNWYAGGGNADPAQFANQPLRVTLAGGPGIAVPFAIGNGTVTIRLKCIKWPVS